MHPQLEQDKQNLHDLLHTTLNDTLAFINSLDELPAAATPTKPERNLLPADGQGTAQVLEQFQNQYRGLLSSSPGGRYWGFVTGGVTPAALVGDWLASAYDQNVAQSYDSIAAHIEEEAIHLLLDLFNLPHTFTGYFVSGATISNVAGLALARQWVAQQHGIDVAQQGLWQLPPIRVLGGKIHSSVYKALAMLGVGRNSAHKLDILPGREALDIASLRQALQETSNPCIVVASAGTVNTVDYDDIAAMADLKREFPFWLHVDGAFGGFAACSPAHAHLLNGWEHADSITIDAHKWLNTPYDSAMIFTPHHDLLFETFQNSAAYLGDVVGTPDPVHMQPQNSRRFRALPAWFTLMAYGRSGYQEIVERQVANAHQLGKHITTSTSFHLMAPVRLNVVCFTLSHPNVTKEQTAQFLQMLQADGTVFITPTVFDGIPGFRAAFSNWSTQAADVEKAWTALERVATAMSIT